MALAKRFVDGFAYAIRLQDEYSEQARQASGPNQKKSSGKAYAKFTKSNAAPKAPSVSIARPARPAVRGRTSSF